MATSRNIATLENRFEELTLKTRAMDESPLGITIADATEPDLPLVYVNEGFERVTGYDGEDVLGQNCRFLQGEATEERPVAEMRRAIEAGESTQVTLRNYRKDGTEFWNEVTLAPLPENGEIPYYVGFQQDVTLRKEYERRLESERDDLDVLNQIVRHDIRNDLQLILSSLELLTEFVDDGGRDHLQTALDSTRQAIELTLTAGDISETILSTGTEYEAIGLGHLLHQELEDARESSPDAVVEVEGTLPQVRVRADEMLDSVFRNLLDNAIQHNDEEVPRVTVSATLRDDDVEVAVADNGPGIPDEQKSVLFDKGTRGDHSGSTGIGLYLVDRLVTNYGGVVWVEDGDDGGAVFYVRLPLAE